jgi:hypothetical protein
MRESEVNLALCEPRLSNGISTPAKGICWGGGAILAMFTSTSFWWPYALIPVAIAGMAHLVLAWAFKKDHQVFEIYGKYSILSNRYQPHARELLPVPFERPPKAGRGVRI